MPSLPIGQQIKALIQSGKFDEARRLVKANPSSKSQAVLIRIDSEEAAQARVAVTPTHDEIAEIKKAIAEKRYDDAELRLLVSYHPDAKKYRQQLAAARASITNLEGRTRARGDVTPSSPKTKDNDVSAEKSIAVLFWLLCALAAFVSSFLKLFD